MSEIQNTTIVVAEATDDGKRIKVKDEKGLTYSIWKTKQDGSETAAIKACNALGGVAGKIISIGYTEKETGTGSGKYRNIVGIRAGNKEEVKQTQTAQTDKEDGLSWGNAKNIAGLWVAHKIIKKEEFLTEATKIHLAKPAIKKDNEIPTVDADTNEEVPPPADNDEIDIQKIPF